MIVVDFVYFVFNVVFDLLLVHLKYTQHVFIVNAAIVVSVEYLLQILYFTFIKLSEIEQFKELLHFVEIHLLLSLVLEQLECFSKRVIIIQLVVFQYFEQFCRSSILLSIYLISCLLLVNYLVSSIGNLGLISLILFFN